MVTAFQDGLVDLSLEILGRLREAREYFVHTRQAWRFVQQLAREGRPVGIVDVADGSAIAADDLEARAQRYAAGRLPVSVFKDLSGILEDWMLGLIRLWLTAHPEHLDPEFVKATGKTRASKDQEIRVPLSRILALPDRAAILGVEIDRVVRGLAYGRPEGWFRYIEPRMKLGRPDGGQKLALREMKAARDVLEHNRGVVNQDYLHKAGDAARYGEGDTIQIEEPYLLECFDLLNRVVEEMADAAMKLSSA